MRGGRPVANLPLIKCPARNQRQTDRQRPTLQDAQTYCAYKNANNKANKPAQFRPNANEVWQYRPPDARQHGSGQCRRNRPRHLHPCGP